MKPALQKNAAARRMFVAMALLLLALGAYFVLRPAAPAFVRLEVRDLPADPAHFRVERETARVFFLKDGQETKLAGLATMDGYCLFLRGRRTIRIQPGFAGECGLYSYLFFESLDKPRKIRFTLVRQRGGVAEKMHEIDSDHVDHLLTQTITLKKKDELFFDFTGYGIVYFSRPVQYRLRENPQRRLVILIGVDTLRADRIGKQVAGRSLTPNIDRFQKEGARFPHAISQSSWTIPAFVSLFTGLYEYNHGVTLNGSLAAQEPQLVESLASRFMTFGFHGGLGLDSRWGYSRGFDFYQEFIQTGPLYPRGGESLFQKAVELIDGGRFPDLFLFLHTYQVHAPYTPPPEYLLRIDPHPAYTQLDVVNSNSPEKTFLPVATDKRQALAELYDAEVLAFDDFFGRFLAELKGRGLYDHAMIVLLSDHGEEFFEHGGWAHSHSLYDELVRIPLVIKFPDGEYAGRTVDLPVGIIDVLPTILAYLRIPYPQKVIDGVSLLPMIKGESKRGPLVTSVSVSRYIEAIPPKLAILDWPRKIIVNYPYSTQDLDYFKSQALPPAVSEYEIYNLAEDPAETRDLARENPGILARWKAQILQLKKRIQETTLRMKQGGSKFNPEAYQKLKSLGYL